MQPERQRELEESCLEAWNRCIDDPEKGMLDLDPGGVSWYVIQTTTDEEREFVYQTLNRFWIEQFPQAAEHFGMTEKG
jgi:hypothetical protein